MQPLIGFIILSHNNPVQLNKLILRLNEMFQNPSIVCHHDFSKCYLAVNDFPKNVSFVEPYVKTAWGDFSLVEATVRAIRLMYDKLDGPDWFVVLSGSDYPIKSAQYIRTILGSSSYDAYLRYELIYPTAFTRWWQQDCYERYCTIDFRLPIITKKLKLAWKKFHVGNPRITNFFLPFSNRFKCFAGSQWFIANRRSAKYILAQYTYNRSLRSHYRKVFIPDESYFHCILVNAANLKIANNELRYIDWSADEEHPKILTHEDLPALLSSDALFARKFDLNLCSTIFNDLDDLITKNSND